MKFTINEQLILNGIGFMHPNVYMHIYALKLGTIMLIGAIKRDIVIVHILIIGPIVLLFSLSFPTVRGWHVALLCGLSYFLTPKKTHFRTIPSESFGLG